MLATNLAENTRCLQREVNEAVVVLGPLGHNYAERSLLGNEGRLRNDWIG